MNLNITSKIQELPQNTQKFENSKSHVRKPQMKKVQQINYSQKWKILRMTLKKIKNKTKKLPQVHLKTKNSKHLKSNVKRPQIKKLKNYSQN